MTSAPSHKPTLETSFTLAFAKTCSERPKSRTTCQTQSGIQQMANTKDASLHCTSPVNFFERVFRCKALPQCPICIEDERVQSFLVY